MYKSNPWFGTDEDLRKFITECHNRDIWVMTDVVYNHMGSCSGGVDDYSCDITFPKEEYYNQPYCDIVDYTN